jgi:hypothetical protein
MATLIPKMAMLDPRIRHTASCKWIVAVFLLAVARIIVAGEARDKIFADRAEVELHRAQNQFQSDTNNPAAAWQFARACFDLADFATNETGRAAIAQQGIRACRQLLASDTNSAPGHYYLAMNYGQLARAEAPSLAAYKLVREMEREFKTAAALDEHFDYAGPARSLGLLYRDAPVWPFSIGSRRKARDWLEQAAKLAPDYPENHLNLVESHLQWRERAEAKRDLQTLEALWPKAQTNFTGAVWEHSWEDWTTRKSAAEQSLAQPPQPAESPKNQH